VIEQELETKRTTLSGLERSKQQLTIRAPIAGKIVNSDRELQVGLWINSSHRMALISPGVDLSIKGLVAESDIDRIAGDAKGVLLPDNLELDAFEVTVQERHRISLESLEDEMLADVYGGRVAVHPEKDLADETTYLKPRKTWFPVVMTATNPEKTANFQFIQTGVVILQGKRQSYAERVGNQIASVLLREFGL
jgi:putative peptide zinc metalloprotease protein